MKNYMKNWKQNQTPVPHTVAQMIVVDARNKSVFMLHRSEAVRSAKNCWSLPSGLHDIGETLDQTCVRELKEEFDLDALEVTPCGFYENIAGDPSVTEHYHWVMMMFVVVVLDVNRAVNKEPDKHDAIDLVLIDEFLTAKFFEKYNFHPSFISWGTRNQCAVRAGLRSIISK